MITYDLHICMHVCTYDLYICMHVCICMCACSSMRTAPEVCYVMNSFSAVLA